MVRGGGKESSRGPSLSEFDYTICRLTGASTLGRLEIGIPQETE